MGKSYLIVVFKLTNGVVIRWVMEPGAMIYPKKYKTKKLNIVFMFPSKEKECNIIFKKEKKI